MLRSLRGTMGQSLSLLPHLCNSTTAKREELLKEQRKRGIVSAFCCMEKFLAVSQLTTKLLKTARPEFHRINTI